MPKTKRILLIDDEEVILFGFSMVLREPGIEVDCAKTLDEARTLIDMHAYDAAIIDLRLTNSTELEGFSCVRFLRASQPKCKIVMLTAYGDRSMRDQASALGVSMFFEKPMEPTAIRNIFKTFGIYN